MTESDIGWTDNTWNPITGCTKVSEGCRNCYAETLALRLQAMNPTGKYRNGFKVTIHPETFQDPLKWRKPSLVFVNSMSDLFHKDIPDSILNQFFDLMEGPGQRHIYQILTKRPERARDYLGRRWFKRLQPPPNIWIGTSIEDHRAMTRIGYLHNLSAAVKFISFEPLIGPIPNPERHLSEIGWVIIGGESGPGHRPMEESWAFDLIKAARASKVPVFFKQWGGARPGGDNRFRGEKIEEYPEAISWINRRADRTPIN